MGSEMPAKLQKIKKVSIILRVICKGLLALVSSHPAKTFRRHADSFGIGAVIILIAWFMDMAVDLREDNELTI